MNINVKIINKRALVANLGGIPTKCPICLLFIRLDYKTWYKIKVETLSFNQNYEKCKLSNSNIHEY